ncbi:putative membrane protein [Spinactinospora alkalitolerans]|uniref:Putative membrane protein n=1 Tax=Spinactinospora alkalitolerans TaxID=687207 RepID=A0A852TXI3_9ACTN|nr:SRPBCC family protein [Spinactinospora alkalitolerans]NYE47642.1 putative membrane protein [Spinactinospora alkalitolerans]
MSEVIETVEVNVPVRTAYDQREGTTVSEVIETVEVNVPVRTAYDQWTQFERFPEFMEGVSRVHQRDDTHTSWVIDIGGRRREFDAVVTEQIADERIAWRSTDGATHAGVVTFHKIEPERARVTLQLNAVPEGVVEQLGDKLGLVKQRAKGDMQRFARFVESRGAATGGYRGEVPQDPTGPGGEGAPLGAPPQQPGQVPQVPPERPR